MTQTDYTTRVLHADEGHFLTQAGEVPIPDRAVTETVYLAATDSPDNWREITADEAAAILEAQREAAEAAIPGDIKATLTTSDDNADGD